MQLTLVMFKEDRSRRDFPLQTHQRVVIGRRSSCDVRIPLPQVSREHCELRIDAQADTVSVRDLDSSNGTYHNGHRVEHALLEPGDTLTIGPVVFTVIINGQPADPEPIPTVLPRGDEHARSSDSSQTASARSFGRSG